MKSALRTLIENRISYDDALSVTNGLGVRAEAELAAKDAALDAAREYRALYGQWIKRSGRYVKAGRDLDALLAALPTEAK